jgi:hypothetical protein
MNASPGHRLITMWYPEISTLGLGPENFFSVTEIFQLVCSARAREAIMPGTFPQATS